jgi:hypothetical protein
MATVTRLNALSTQNPYEAAVAVDSPESRIRAFPFAISATIAFQLAAMTSTGNNLSVYVGTPTAIIENVVPVFVFAYLIGRFNGITDTTGKRRVAIAGRLLGGCVLGTIAIPVNSMAADYLYLVPFPRKVAEILAVLLLSVLICTVSERLFLRILDRKQALNNARIG